MSSSTQERTNSRSRLPLVIVNPKSAGGSTHNRWAAAASDLRTHFGAFEVAFTAGPGDAANIAEQESNGGRGFIIACGGDGTINEVANGILRSGSDCELGILPSGTGGDFRRSIGVPASTRQAATALRDGITRRIDVGHVSFVDHSGAAAERYFLNVSSFGLATSIIHRVKATSSFNWLPAATLRGKANFAVSTLREVIDIAPQVVSVSIDGGERYNLQTVAFCVANARYFGGGMMIAPDAKLDDGNLDLINIGDISTLRIMLNAYTLYLGTHAKLPEVNSRRVTRIDVAPVDPRHFVPLETDGELPGRLPATYSVIPSALKIRTPRG
jgi:diacylglycerol kinase (ATP)